MLSQEIEKSFVFALFHVEQSRHDLVIAARFLEPAPDDFADVRSRDFALHEQGVDRGPERLALIDETLVGSSATSGVVAFGTGLCLFQF
jgi:hypothetical protein